MRTTIGEKMNETKRDDSSEMHDMFTKKIVPSKCTLTKKKTLNLVGNKEVMKQDDK